MQTIGRNEPCLCGSGKKYKKCCGVKESDALKQAVLERETVDVQSEILRFAFSYSAFSQAVQKNFAKYKLETDMRNTFYFFVGIWALFTKTIANGKTAVELFVNGKGPKGSGGSNLRPGLQAIIQSWIGQAPAAVKVVEVDDRNLVVADIFTKQTKKVKIIDKLTEIPAKGALLSGYIVPFVDDISIFFTSALSFEGKVADKIEQVVLQKYEEYLGKKGNTRTGGKAEKTPESFLQESFLDLLELFMSDEEPDDVINGNGSKAVVDGAKPANKGGGKASKTSASAGEKGTGAKAAGAGRTSKVADEKAAGAGRTSKVADEKVAGAERSSKVDAKGSGAGRTSKVDAKASRASKVVDAKAEKSTKGTKAKANPKVAVAVDAEKEQTSKSKRVVKKKNTSTNAIDKIEWNNEQEKTVASLLGEQLERVDVGKYIVEAGYMLWRSYCDKKQPAIKNEKIYAAALHYLVLDKVPSEEKLTQKEAAELYDASPASVSSRSREMASVLENELQDLVLEKV
ncbi:SEC-C metal-binding domain-containing protein [Calidifontibacillus oryziterrae]|uniref:SEC-C metal-binding domain-containing protein n=1 Tax=Calidifontibacillus oryziterrae TaxID=1191699 RepID=UPI00031169D8|nr:SEC-C metal-binding domain-containing protein [Calidifontibacillus oryziterrae]